MTNEEMAARIQAGEKELLAPLWEQNRGLLYQRARRYEALGRLHGLDCDDLMQCAFLALSKAVEGFQEEKGYKLTAYHLPPGNVPRSDRAGTGAGYPGEVLGWGKRDALHKAPRG